MWNYLIRGVLAGGTGAGIAYAGKDVSSTAGRIGLCVGAAAAGAVIMAMPNPFEKKGQTSTAPAGQPAEVRVPAPGEPARAST